MPLGDWFRGGLRELFADTLLSPGELCSAATSNRRSCAALVDEHLAGTRDHTLRLWQLVVFERWHQRTSTTPEAARPLAALSP